VVKTSITVFVDITRKCLDKFFAYIIKKNVGFNNKDELN